MARAARGPHSREIKSMTGYGRGEGSSARPQDHCRGQFSQPQANRGGRQPAQADLEVLEAQIRDEINPPRFPRADYRARGRAERFGRRRQNPRGPCAGQVLRARPPPGSARTLACATASRWICYHASARRGSTGEEIVEAEEPWPATAAALNTALEMMLQMRAARRGFPGQGFERAHHPNAPGHERACGGWCRGWSNIIARSCCNASGRPACRRRYWRRSA